MSDFRLVCCQCGSDLVLEKSGLKKLDWIGDRVKHGQGIQRKCLNCNNESFIIFKTWLE